MVLTKPPPIKERNNVMIYNKKKTLIFLFPTNTVISLIFIRFPALFIHTFKKYLY